jgi:alkanesulfonate monooxygenase SsuD/methylene tetrahydromethanopterin reductase-like flavin-dependent oxidoreductase (luciferase family)
VKISVSMTNFSWPEGPRGLAAHVDEVAVAADAAGVDTLWVADHLLQVAPNTSLDEPMLEAYTTLGYLAARTTRLRLGTMVTWAGVRPAALLVKAVTTLDVLTGGRAWLGIGAGYREDEARMMGLPFASTKQRFEILEETLGLAIQMWSGDETSVTGRHINLERPIAHPGPLSKPRPRILIGGMGEHRTLPLVARYGDACNLFDIPDGGQTIRHKLEVLDGLCLTAGRRRSDIEATVTARLEPSETAASLIDRSGAFSSWGIEHIVLISPEPWNVAQLETVAAAIAVVGDGA